MIRILAMNTGGTLGMVGNPLVPAKSAAELIAGIKVPPNVELILVDFVLLQDSTNVWNPDRVQMAEAIRDHYDTIDAILLLHGTDSLEVTCAIFLMIFKLSLQKPMMVVGAQFTKDESGSDVFMQIENSLRTLEAFVHFGIVGVYNLTINDVWDGSRVVKKNESDVNAFHTPGRYPVAKCWPHIMLSESLRRKDPVLDIQGLRLDTFFDHRIQEGLKVSADTDPRGLTTWVDAGLYSAVIMEAKGAGNIPDRLWPFASPPLSWIDAIEYATNRGVYSAIISPFEDGRVNLKRYLLGQKAEAAGALSLESLTPPMAQAKLRQAVAMFPGDPVRIQKFLSTNIVGELLTGMEFVG